jgi:predicted nucleotidyltransferase
MINPFQNHQEELQQLIGEYGITYLALFGSRARGDNRPDSDYDFLLDFDEERYPGLFELDDIE